jgi:hypothetical protein
MLQSFPSVGNAVEIVGQNDENPCGARFSVPLSASADSCAAVA